MFGDWEDFYKQSCSLREVALEVPKLFFTHSLFSGWRGEDSFLGRFVVEKSTIVFIISKSL